MIIADLVKHSDSYLELLNKFSEQINFINSKAEVPGAGIEMLQSIIDNGKNYVTTIVLFEMNFLKYIKEYCRMRNDLVYHMVLTDI